MKICGTKCGDFVVWQEKELIVERITIDQVLLAVALESATNFFIYGILPEILGKWYSRLPQYSDHLETESDQTVQRDEWCFCHGEESGEMILCDNEHCQVKWFHTECLRIKKIPRSKWFCPECAKGKRRKREIE